MINIMSRNNAGTVIKTSRSPYVASLMCSRKGWWGQFFNGTGIQPVGRKSYFVTGSACHYGVQSLVTGRSNAEIKKGIEAMFTEARKDIEVVDEQDFQEQVDLSIAITKLWEIERLPQWAQEYRVLAVEPEIQVHLGDLGGVSVELQSRPDLIMQRWEDGLVFQTELKFNASFGYNWSKSWETNMQLAAQTLAVKQWMAENLTAGAVYGGAVIEGVAKGSRRADEAGVKRGTSNLIYAYTRPGDGHFVPPTLSHSWRKGLAKELVSKYMPVEDWVADLPQAARLEKICVVPTITPSDGFVESARRQWVYRAIKDQQNALSIGLAAPDSRAELLDRFFQQNTDHCTAMAGCEFYMACHDFAVNEDPIGSGKFKVREANHPIDISNEGD